MYDNTVKTLLNLCKSLEYSRVIFPIDLHLIFEISSFKNEFDEFVFLSTYLELDFNSLCSLQKSTIANIMQQKYFYILMIYLFDELKIAEYSRVKSCYKPKIQ